MACSRINASTNFIPYWTHQHQASALSDPPRRCEQIKRTGAQNALKHTRTRVHTNTKTHTHTHIETHPICVRGVRAHILNGSNTIVIKSQRFRSPKSSSGKSSLWSNWCHWNCFTCCEIGFHHRSMVSCLSNCLRGWCNKIDIRTFCLLRICVRVLSRCICTEIIIDRSYSYLPFLFSNTQPFPPCSSRPLAQTQSFLSFLLFNGRGVTQRRI